MERRLVIALAGLSLALAIALAGVLFVGSPLVNTALAQAGIGRGSGSPCLGSGLGLLQMPCLTRQTGEGGTVTGTQSAGNVLKDAEAAGLAFYKLKYGDDQVNVKATDYGCHVQADVYKDGKLVKSLGYDRAGGIYEFN